MWKGLMPLYEGFARLSVEKLQDRLNLIWIIHNFVRVHYTTKEVPAVTSGVIEEGLTLEDVLRLKGVNS
jgi:hypothetical protein